MRTYCTSFADISEQLLSLQQPHFYHQLLTSINTGFTTGLLKVWAAHAASPKQYCGTSHISWVAYCAINGVISFTSRRKTSVSLKGYFSLMLVHFLPLSISFPAVRIKMIHRVKGM